MSLGRVSGIRNGMMRELAKKVTVPKLVKKSSKSRSFHFRYLELCRNKNLTPLPEIRKKSNETTLLELYADKLTVSDWLLIIEAIHHDLTLKTFVLRMRRTYQHNTIDPIDTENRARRFTQRPVIFTRFIFRALVQAISNCVLSNKNLTVVKLEGLPLYEGYIEGITKSLSGNDRLETLSFRKSTLGDKGCQLVCNTAKYLNRITIVDLSECNITCQGAVYVAEMIKIQKISRFTEGWEKSLRYQTPDMNSLLGLRTVLLANNPNIGDKGLSCIVDVLKEDAWIRVVDMQGCGLTDVGANDILSLLDLNTFIKEFHVRNNVGISQALQRTIHERLLPPEIEHKQEDEFDSNFLRDTENGKYPQGKKATIVKLLSHAKAVEDKLAFERVLRQKAEDLNFKLTKQLMYKDSQMADDNVSQRPDTPKDHMQMKKDVKVSPTPRQMRKTNEYIEMKEDFQESPTHRQMRKTKEYMEMEEDVPESPTYRQMRKTKEYMEMKEDVPESPRYRQMRKTKEYMEMKEDVPESPRYRQMRKTKEYMEMKEDVPESPTYRQMRKTKEYMEKKEDVPESPTYRQMRKTNEYLEMEEDVPESPKYRQMRKTKEYMEMKEDVRESPKYRQMRKTKEYMEMKEDVRESPKYRQMRKTNEYLEMEEDVPESPKYRQMRKTNEYQEMEEDVPESPTYRQMRKTNEYLEMEEDVPESPKYRQMRKTNEYLEMEEDVPESPTYRQMRQTNEYLEMEEEYLSGSSTYCATLVGSSMTTPELTPRSDAKTLCPYDESEDTDSRSQGMDPMEFSHLDVRKVRSEMKYVESNVNEGKKNRESKSDHEFANELHFKLNSMVHFERDIGDSAKVSAKQAHRYEDAGDEQDIGPTSMIQDGSKQVVEQINLPTKKKTGVVKAGQKQRRARNDGGGDGQCNSVEQSEHHIGPTVMIKDGQTQEQDRNDGGGDGKRSKVAKQRRRAKMPDSIG
ncbi:protein Cep78 homolog isoform X28 [Drosophila pseudoobscura]|uniref:Protein Cep78 homolog isoform X28 n=1 Tax=Drosophila pseudoobscura pseudoobscura TaxID=46245 RepID=A0A6I8W3G9_DROPS|nr:protein Cep78 homolog isoform X28 [Drosophila pseudoobscura]